MNQSEDIYTVAFQDYKAMGLDPLPIPHQNGNPTKRPTDDNWQIRAANGGYTEADFKIACNMGNLLGGPKHFSDLDCDSPEAIRVASDVMKDLERKIGRTMVFGRASKPRSHYIHTCDASLPSEKITDPSDGECIIEYRCVNEDGQRGKQTVFPPSSNFDEKTDVIEQVCFEFDSAQTIAKVSAKVLHRTFRFIGAVALLAKHFPVKSERHDTILSLAGLFARAGMKKQMAVATVERAYRHSKGYHNDRTKCINDTEGVFRDFERHRNVHLFGYPRLIEIMPKEVVDKVLELLDIERPESTYSLSDAGNGRRLVEKHKDNIRFCVDDQDWYIWDGVLWRRDATKRIRELAKGIANDLRQEAEQIRPPTLTSNSEDDKKALAGQDTRKRELMKWANQTENADRVSKTILSATSDPKITCSRLDFDQNLHLLNCPNCVVDLHTGSVLPHDRKLMLSSLCPTEYDANATHSVWDQSLAAFTRRHNDLLPFLKRVAGYSMQGDKTEERILILYGPGNAGKGSFVDWLTNALGPDYSCAMEAASVLKQKRDSAAASGDVARLEGKRLVVVSEIEKGSRIQESFMKQASGNDSLVARSLYKSEREFRPTHQFWFQTNYRPGFDSTDSGNQRRYVEIPFDNELPQDPLVQFDKTVKNRMRRDKDFLKAVLAWAVAGCVEWRRDGLKIPDSVEAATKQLFAHNDFLREFLVEQCVAETAGKVPMKEFREGYERWCGDQGEEPAHGRTFNRMMEERGFEKKQARVDGTSCKAWHGIRLKTHDELVGNVPASQSAPAKRRDGPTASIESILVEENSKIAFKDGFKVA
jgi:P4 family phage/plasmid primase-like protien